jgi:hypothetical protein
VHRELAHGGGVVRPRTVRFGSPRNGHRVPGERIHALHDVLDHRIPGHRHGQLVRDPPRLPGLEPDGHSQDIRPRIGRITGQDVDVRLQDGGFRDRVPGHQPGGRARTPPARRAADGRHAAIRPAVTEPTRSGSPTSSDPPPGLPAEGQSQRPVLARLGATMGRRYIPLVRGSTFPPASDERAAVARHRGGMTTMTGPRLMRCPGKWLGRRSTRCA